MSLRFAAFCGVFAVVSIFACSESSGGAGPTTETPSEDAAVPSEAEGDATIDAPPSAPDAAGCPGKNLLRDPKNCGRCGRVCEVSACDDGACAPKELTANIYLAGLIGISGDDLYAYAPTSGLEGPCVVHRFPKVGGAPATVVTFPICPGDFAAANGVLMWRTRASDTGGIAVHACSLPACGDARSLAPGDTFDDALATDGTNVYWYDQAGVVRRCALQGCPGGPSAVFSPGTDVGEIVVDGADMFTLGHFDGTVRRCALTGCAAGGTVVVEGRAGISRRLSVGPSSVAFVYSTHEKPSDTSLYTCPRTGCGATPTISPLGKTYGVGVGVDGTDVFLGSPELSVVSCPLGGCMGAPRPVASGKPISLLYLDATHLYFYGQSAAGATLFRAPK